VSVKQDKYEDGGEMKGGRKRNKGCKDDAAGRSR
jgi:hypothetical protein